MLKIIAGTVKSAVKLSELDMKWQQKKANPGKKIAEEDPQIKQFKEDIKRMHESEKVSAIAAKLKAGQGLTPGELEYIKKNNPDIYKEAMEVKAEKEAYERQLKECKTKEDVQKLNMSKMGDFMAQAKTIMNNPNIPDGKKLELMEKLLKKTKGVESVHLAFVESSSYENMPADAEIREEAERDNASETKAPDTPVMDPDMETEAENDAEDTAGQIKEPEEQKPKAPALTELKEETGKLVEELLNFLVINIKTN